MQFLKKKKKRIEDVSYFANIVSDYEKQINTSKRKIVLNVKEEDVNAFVEFVEDTREYNNRCPKCGGLLIANFGPGISVEFCAEDNCDYEDYDYDL